MRIAYAYELDAGNINSQSGRPYSILRQMERRADHVERLFPLADGMKFLFAPRYFYHQLRGQTYRPDRERILLKSLAGQIQRRLDRVKADVVFCPGSHAIAELDTAIPKIFCADATFANVIEFYEGFSRMAPVYLDQGHRLEARALKSCAAAIYPSEWAAQSAVRDYGADPSRVHVVPFGANIEAPPPDVVADMIDARRNGPIKLLFSGRDWIRKGGDIVIETARLLHGGGMRLELHLIGVSESLPDLPDYVVNHGLLDKRREDDLRTLERLMKESHFMFVPSRAENYGMTFCEAAAYGLPSVSTAVGGIPTIVRDGVTGACLPPEAGAPEYAEAIRNLSDDWENYRALCHASLREYHNRLNWDQFGKRLIEIVQDAVSR